MEKTLINTAGKKIIVSESEYQKVKESFNSGTYTLTVTDNDGQTHTVTAADQALQ